MGLLVGIERERAHEDIPWFAGIRTFPLFTLFGFLCAGGADIAVVCLRRHCTVAPCAPTTADIRLIRFSLRPGPRDSEAMTGART